MAALIHKVFALGAAYVIAGLSVFACGYFGTVLGKGVEGLIYAVVFASLDVLKFCLPYYINAFWFQGQFWRSFIATGLFLLFAVGSIICEIGVYKVTFAHSSAPILASQANYKVDEDEKSDLELQIGQLSAGTLADAKANVSKLKLDNLYKRSAKCTDATVPDSQLFCAELTKANAELEKAEGVERLRGKLDVVKERLRSYDMETQSISATPQADAIAAVVGLFGFKANRSAMPDIIAIIIAGSIEPAALFLFLIHRPVPVMTLEPKIQVPPQPTPITADPIEQWSRDALVRHASATMSPVELLESFNEWASVKNYERVSQTMLGRRLAELGFDKKKVDGRMRYLGVAPRKLRVVG